MKSPISIIFDWKGRRGMGEIWLRHQPLCHVEGQYCMVHAGLLPQWTVRKERSLSAEVETALAQPLAKNGNGQYLLSPTNEKVS